MQNKYYGFIYCIEFLAIEGRHKDWQTCFNTLGLPAKPVLDCYKSGNGTKVSFIGSVVTIIITLEIPMGSFFVSPVSMFSLSV